MNDNLCRSSVGLFVRIMRQVMLLLIVFGMLSGCQVKLKLVPKETPPPPEPEVVRKDIAADFNSVVDSFLKGHFLCNGAEPSTVFLKPFGSNCYKMPHLDSYFHELCENKLRLNECVKLVYTMKSKPRFVIETHIINDAEMKLLVNVLNNKNKDIIFTNTVPFVVGDINHSDYIEHKTKTIKSKKYAFLTLKSQIQTYTYEDSYTLKGPKVEGSYSGSAGGSARYNSDYKSKYSRYNDRSTGYYGYDGSSSSNRGGRVEGRAMGRGMYSRQETYTYDVGDSAIYPVDQKCFINGALKKENEDQLYFEDAVEANKKLYLSFSFVGAEWDALNQKQKKHKKYKKKCYIIPKEDESIVMTVSYVYQKEKKGIYVDARNSKNEQLKVYYY